MYVSIIYVRKNKSVNLSDFFNRQRLSQMEKKATLIMANPKLRMVFVVAAALLMTAFTYNPVMAVMNPFDKIGWVFWGYVKSFGRMACLILAGVEVIKSLGAGDSKSIAKVIFKYAIAYAAFTILPWVFDTMDKEFKL